LGKFTAMAWATLGFNAHGFEEILGRLIEQTLSGRADAPPACVVAVSRDGNDCVCTLELGNQGTII